tara:strand:+ start:355 stop:486 length:132 start_codon:yes stop_codon:yes gene_type:complete
VGCGVDSKSYAEAYAKHFKKASYCMRCCNWGKNSNQLHDGPLK